MTNEVINLPDYSVSYQPAPIEINNYEGLSAAVAQYMQRYSDLVITNANAAETKKLRAKLNGLKKALDERRKEIKRDYNGPLKAFEKKVRDLEANIDDVIQPIDAGLSELEAQRKQQKENEIHDLVAEMAPNYGVDIAEIELDPRWLNKSISQKQVITEIAGTMQMLKAAKDKLADDTAMIERYSKAVQVDPVPWIDQLNQGQDVQYILSGIDNQVEQARKREEQRRLRAEAAAEHQQETSTGKIVDTDTGEVVSFTKTLKITATKDQMWELANYMKRNNIKFETVGG